MKELVKNLVKGISKVVKGFNKSSGPDFRYVKIPNVANYTIQAPKRATRPHIERKDDFCPFCPEGVKGKKEIYKISGEKKEDWQVLVIPNKFPFAPIHDIVIHTPDHSKHFSDFTDEEMKLVLEAFVNRYNAYKDKGSVVIFQNSGHEAGESIGHSHSQIAVPSKEIEVQVPKLEFDLNYPGEHYQVDSFKLICPPYSQWPDEVWIVPDKRNLTFGEITYEEIESLSKILKRVIKLFTIRHGHQFPHNFYIYPFADWYLRIMPRAKTFGGFEASTGIFVNTQDPKETMEFIKELYDEKDEEKIKAKKAEYRRGV